MNHFFRALTAAIALIAAMGMGMGSMGAAAQNATAENETAVNVSAEWPDRPSNVSVQDARAALEEDPADLPTETVVAVAAWVSDPANYRELGASERERARDWVMDAQALESIDRPDLPDVPDLPGGDRDDRADRDGTGTRTDASEDELNESGKVIDNATVDTLANQERIAFNNDTRILGWEFRDGQVTVALHTDRRAGVTVSDALAGMDEPGAVAVPKTTQFLERDEVTIVRMDVSEYDGGHAVGVEIDGMTVRITSEMSEENPLRNFGGQSGLITGMALAIVMSGVAAAFVIRREETGVVKA
jgi:hypothetical protein